MSRTRGLGLQDLASQQAAAILACLRRDHLASLAEQTLACSAIDSCKYACNGYG